MEVRRDGRLLGALGIATLLATSGCTIAPKRFSDTIDPAPLVRARAATMGDHLPPQVVVPALLERLDDDDPVVRLTAHEELKRRTRQDFGYEPWATPEARAQAATRWRSWWAQAVSGTAGGTAAAGNTRRSGRPRSVATQVRHSLPRVSPTSG